MKRIAYIMPIDYIRGNICGRQDLTYNGGDAYAANGKVAAENYQPRLVAKVLRLGNPNMLRFYQIRTRSSVNVTPAQKHRWAVMGGAGALFAGLLNSKNTQLYADCIAEWKRRGVGQTFRKFMIGDLMEMVDSHYSALNYGDSVFYNPWVDDSQQSVPVKQSIIDKFASELS